MTETETSSPWRSCLLIILVVLAAGYVAYKALMHNLEMQRIPDNITVTNTIYQEEDAWGIGPGAAEVGLAVYELNENDARKLMFAQHVLNDDAKIRRALGETKRRYGDWKITPIETEGEDARMWQGSEFDNERRNPSLILNYLDVYGYGHLVPIDPEIAESIDRIISSPGSYYAYGGGGALIIVAPAERRVIFAYAG